MESESIQKAESDIEILVEYSDNCWGRGESVFYTCNKKKCYMNDDLEEQSGLKYTHFKMFNGTRIYSANKSLLIDLLVI